MKKFLILAVMLLAVMGVAVYAQIQADVTVTYTLKAADVTILKTALIAQGTERGPGMGGPVVGDIIDGTYTITDANIQNWLKKQLKQQVDQALRQYDERVLREAVGSGMGMPDLSTMDAAMKAAWIAKYKALMAEIKK